MVLQNPEKKLEYATKLGSVLEKINLDDSIRYTLNEHKHKIIEVTSDVCGLKKVSMGGKRSKKMDMSKRQCIKIN